MPASRTLEREAPRMAAEPTDAELVRQARGGKREFLGMLVGRHIGAARSVAGAVLSDRSLVDDVVQEAFLRAFRNLDLLADPARFGPWLGRVTFAAAIDSMRASRRATTVSLEELPDGGASLADGGASPLDHAEQRQRAAAIARALEQLPERYRQPITLYHLDGLSHARVAEALGVPEATARSLAARARRRLAASLGGLREAPARHEADDVFQEHPVPRILHVHNGDVVRDKLARSGVPGDHAVYADPLHDGPLLPIDAPAERRRAARVEFLAEAGWTSERDLLDMLARWDHDLERWTEYDEVVLWFEHDLFDQLLLVRHLAYFAERSLGTTVLSLICIGEYPGMPAFKGLGELSPDQLASLLGTRQRITQRQLALGRRTWHALAAEHPAAVEALVDEEDLTPLPFLRAALRRFLQELPDQESGLGRIERAVLEGVRDGITDPVKLFRAVQAADDVFFIGDLSLWHCIWMMAAGSQPLLTGEPRPANGPAPFGALALTAAGRDVLDGTADRIRLAGIDRWWGGVHLHGHEVPWRWDRQAQRVARIPDR